MSSHLVVRRLGFGGLGCWSVRRLLWLLARGLVAAIWHASVPDMVVAARIDLVVLFDDHAAVSFGDRGGVDVARGVGLAVAYAGGDPGDQHGAQMADR